jgi:hypothetical protein
LVVAIAASLQLMLLTEPTYNRNTCTAFAWRARNLSQKTPHNLSPSECGNLVRPTA